MNNRKDKSKILKINVNDKIKVSEDISTSTSVLSVSASGFDDIDREYYFPTATGSGEIATTTTKDLGFELRAKEHEKFVESLDIVKTYVSEIEIKFSLKGIKFKIKKEPKKKIIKFYKK